MPSPLASVAIIDGLAVIARAAAGDLEEAGIPAERLRAVQLEYERGAEVIRASLVDSETSDSKEADRG